MADPRYLKFATLSLHAGQPPDPLTGARATPIHQTTSYVFPSADHAAQLFNLERPGHVYSRISNPTVAVLEERLSALEGGVGAVATASGQAALHLAIATLMGAGGHVVCSARVYGGTHNLLAQTLPRFGITTSFVDPRDPDAFARAIRPETALVIAEVLGNPGLEVLDLPAVAERAHSAGVPVLIDSTFTTPALFRPFEYGADLVVHSLTKFIGGHGIAIGGAVIDGGCFDWEAAAQRFPTLTEPYDGYHGLDFAEQYGPCAFVMRARNEGLRDFGACLSPGNAFYLLQGLETLPLRMARHSDNARQIATFLETHKAVSWVNYPGLPSHPDHALACRMLPNGQGGILSFGVTGGRAMGRQVIDRVTLFSHLANVGDAKSLIIHPASTTHQQMDAASLATAGIGEDMIRLSVGLEDVEDLIADLDQALKGAARAVERQESTP